jgi:archaellum component FlaC
MNKKLTWFAIGAAAVGMGIAMPQCPGQQAMQQQLDAVQASSTDAGKKIQAMNTQVGSLNNDMNQVKQLLAGMANTIQESKGQLMQLDSTVKDLQAKVTAMASAPAKGKKKH